MKISTCNLDSSIVWHVHLHVCINKRVQIVKHKVMQFGSDLKKVVFRQSDPTWHTFNSRNALNCIKQYCRSHKVLWVYNEVQVHVVGCKWSRFELQKSKKVPFLPSGERVCTVHVLTTQDSGIFHLPLLLKIEVLISSLSIHMHIIL